MAELDRALDLFFTKVFLPGDSLIVVTPRARYSMRPDALTISRTKLKDQLRGKLRQDILAGNTEYLGAIHDLETAMSNDAVTLLERLDLYSAYLTKLESLRRVDEASLLQFGEYLKTTPGQKTRLSLLSEGVHPQAQFQDPGADDDGESERPGPGP